MWHFLKSWLFWPPIAVAISTLVGQVIVRLYMGPLPPRKWSTSETDEAITKWRSDHEIKWWEFYRSVHGVGAATSLAGILTLVTIAPETFAHSLKLNNAFSYFSMALPASVFGYLFLTAMGPENYPREYEVISMISWICLLWVLSGVSSLIGAVSPQAANAFMVVTIVCAIVLAVRAKQLIMRSRRD